MNALTVIDHSRVGYDMRQIRKRAGLNMAAMATLMQWPVEHIVELENGRQPWTLQKVQRWLAATEQENIRHEKTNDEVAVFDRPSQMGR